MTSICVPKPANTKLVIVKKSHRFKFKMGNACTRLAVIQTRLAPGNNFLVPSVRQDNTSTVTMPAEENYGTTVITKAIPLCK